MGKIYICGLDCDVATGIRLALQGCRIIVPAEKNGKPSLELINFTEEEATELYNEVTEGIGNNAKLIVNPS